MRKLIFVFVAIMALSAQSAHAGLHICNQTGSTVWVAVAMRQDANPALAMTRGIGWFRVENGSCETTWDHPLQENGHWFWYALVRDTSGYWSDIRETDTGAAPPTLSFCAEISDFDRFQAMGVEASCERHNYTFLDNSTENDFTMTLSPK